MELATYLEKLQFTSYEKKIILYLATIEAATATMIVKASNVPQGKVYQTLALLANKGILETTPAKPQQYMIRDVKSALAAHLERQRDELAQKQAQLRSITTSQKTTSKASTISVAAIKGREEYIAAIAQMRNDAKKEVLQSAPLFTGSFAASLALERSAARGIKNLILIRKITAQNKATVRKAIASGAEVRMTQGEMLSMAITDEEFIIQVHDYSKDEEKLAIRSRNTGLRKALHEQFMNYWKKAKTVKA